MAYAAWLMLSKDQQDRLFSSMLELNPDELWRMLRPLPVPAQFASRHHETTFRLPRVVYSSEWTGRGVPKPPYFPSLKQRITTISQADQRVIL